MCFTRDGRCGVTLSEKQRAERGVCVDASMMRSRCAPRTGCDGKKDVHHIHVSHLVRGAIDAGRDIFEALDGQVDVVLVVEHHHHRRRRLDIDSDVDVGPRRSSDVDVDC